METSGQQQLETDGKGRPLVENMSADEKLSEIVLTMRAVSDGMEALQSSPMFGAIGKMFGGKGK